MFKVHHGAALWFTTGAILYLALHGWFDLHSLWAAFVTLIWVAAWPVTLVLPLVVRSLAWSLSIVAVLGLAVWLGWEYLQDLFKRGFGRSA